MEYYSILQHRSNVPPTHQNEVFLYPVTAVTSEMLQSLTIGKTEIFDPSLKIEIYPMRLPSLISKDIIIVHSFCLGFWE